MLLKRKRLEKSRDLRKISRLESPYAKAVEGNSLRRLQLTNKTKKKFFFSPLSCFQYSFYPYRRDHRWCSRMLFLRCFRTICASDSLEGTTEISSFNLNQMFVIYWLPRWAKSCRESYWYFFTLTVDEVLSSHGLCWLLSDLSVSFGKWNSVVMPTSFLSLSTDFRIVSYLRTFYHHIACFHPGDETAIIAPQRKENSCIIFAGK